MKQFGIGLAAIAMLNLLQPIPAGAQADEIQQLILNYEKLAQLKKILQNMYRGYDVLSNGYNTVKGISQGNFNLHDVFLNDLLSVSPAVRNYKRVADIIEDQGLLVQEYKHAYSRFRKDPNFNPDELSYIGRVYDNLFNQSLKNIDALAIVITAGKLRMSDDERLKEIDKIYADTRDKLAFLRRFNSNTATLALQRSREHNDNHTVQQLYGVQN